MSFGFSPTNGISKKPSFSFRPQPKAEVTKEVPQKGEEFSLQIPEDLVSVSPPSKVDKTELRASVPTIAMSTAQQAAVANLGPAVGASVMNVWSVLSDQGETKENFLQLLDQGTLAESNGDKTTAQYLENLSARPRAHGLEPDQTTAETINMLADPEDTIYQGTSATCAVANLQYQLSEDAPNFAKFVDGLTSPSGVAQFPSGNRIERRDDSLVEDLSHRSPTNRVIQSSLMNQASIHRGTYYTEEDIFDDGSKGLDVREMCRQTEIATGVKHGFITHDGESTKAIRKLVTETPEGETFQAGMSWNDSNHMLLVTQVKDDEVTYFNPQGESSKLPLGKFLFKTQFIMMPEERLQTVEVSDWHRGIEA